MSKCRILDMKVGSWLTTVKKPKTANPWQMMMAQTAGEQSSWPQGTWLGRFLEVVVPMASSISRLSSAEIRGWVAGVS